MAGRPVKYPVRPEILASWRRAVSQGLQPDRAAPAYDDRPTDEDPLLAAADAVLRALEQDLEGTDATVVLTDARGRIVARRGHDGVAGRRLDRIGVAPGFVWGEEQVGTNALGTAAANRAAVLVAGDEHFADVLTGVCGGAAPVTDPCGSGPIGVVAILRRAHDASHLLVTIARQAARDIEHRLRDAATERQRVLHLPPESPGPRASIRRGGRPRSGRPRFGWDSLSETELVVADLATRGRTNRQIADTLVVSPHTVDSHVRHIYGKLGISSRIALTHVMLAHDDRRASQT